MDKTSEILDLLPVACYHLNTNYLITYVNRYASKLFGHFPEDCLGCDIRKLFPETKVTSCFRVMDSALNGRRPGSHDYVSAVTHRWIRLTATPSSHGAVVSFSDIHDLKKDGQNPEIHEAGFRSLFSMMDTGFCIIQKEPGQHLPLSDYLFLAANPAFERHTGLRTAAGKTIRQLLPAVEDRILDFLDTCIETGEPQYLEEYVSALDSWIEAKIFRLPAPEQLAVLFNNVTARKKAELELRRSEEQFRLLVIATSNMVYRMSADWSEMYNLNGKNILADTEHPTGSWVEKYIPEEERPLVDHKIRQAIQAKSIFELEHRVVQANGSVGWVYSRAVPMLDHDGNITEWLGAGSDITPRKEAEDAQNESERRFKASSAKYLSLFNSIDQGFCIVEMIFNTEGIPVDYRVLETNPAFKKLSGMHEATGKTMRTLAPDMDEHWYRIFGEVAQTGVPKRFVERVTRVDRWFDVYAFEIDTRAGHIAILFNDVTQQKRQEEQQRYLIRLSGALYSAPNPEEIKEASARILGEQVKAARGFYFTTERHGRGPQSGLTSAGAYSLGIDTPDSEIVRFPEIGDDLYADIAAGKPLIVEDVGLPGQPVYSCRDPYLKLGIRSFVIVPFTKNGNAVAAFAVTDNFPRKWSVHEISLVKVTVERTWEAVERARAELALRENEALYRSRLEQEVTERTAELRQTKDLLRGTLNSSLSSIQVFRSVRDQTGKIVDFTWILNNDTSEKTFGAVNGKSLLQRNPGVVPSGIFDHFVQVAETGIPQQYEIRYNFENYDGWYYQSVVKLGDGVAATTADITLRKLAEEERFRNYLLLQQSEELAQSGSWDLDLLSGVVNWSDGMYRLFAIPQGVQVKPEIYLESATPKGRRVVERLVRHLRDADHEFEETVELKVGEKVKVLHVKAAVVRDDQGIPVRILGVDMDISAMREAERQLRDLQVRQQQEILLVTLNTQEKERRRISENLHNGLAQMLYATLLNLNLQTMELAKKDPEEYYRTKKYTERLLIDSIKECRRISHELMPPILAQFGLDAAIKDVCSQLREGIHMKCKITLNNVKLENYIELAIFRTVQELILNIIKHAHATEAYIEVNATENTVLVRVQDNGKGIMPASEEKSGIGLSSIREKVNLLNGSIDIESSPGKGTRVEVGFPITVFMTTGNVKRVYG